METLQLPSGVQPGTQATPCFVQTLLQLSTPVVVVPQAGAGAEHMLGLRTQTDKNPLTLTLFKIAPLFLSIQLKVTPDWVIQVAFWAVLPGPDRANNCPDDSLISTLVLVFQETVLVQVLAPAAI